MSVEEQWRRYGKPKCCEADPAADEDEWGALDDAMNALYHKAEKPNDVNPPEPTPAERAEHDSQERVRLCTQEINAALTRYGCALPVRITVTPDGRVQGTPIVTAR